jgi:hypothetical protein
MVSKLTLFFETLQKYIDSKKILHKNSCIYFHKNLYYDANFTATNLVSLDKICVSICLNYENVNIRKNPLRIFQCQLRTYLLATKYNYVVEKFGSWGQSYKKN